MPVNIIAQEQNDKAGLWEVRRDTNTLRLKQMTNLSHQSGTVLQDNLYSYDRNDNLNELSCGTLKSRCGDYENAEKVIIYLRIPKEAVTLP